MTWKERLEENFSRNRLKRWIFERHWIISAVSMVVAFTCWGCVPILRAENFLIPAVAAILGFSYFILKQEMEEIRLFKELYKEFNERYSVMNDRLYKLREDTSDGEFEMDDVQFLYDYFNLCSEEFLYYEKGFIYAEVWNSWQNGMAIFCESSKIRKLWNHELQTGSYYGMPLPNKPNEAGLTKPST